MPETSLRIKNSEKIESGFADLQDIEIARDPQRNFWKSLAKKAADLEKLGKKRVEIWSWEAGHERVD